MKLNICSCKEPQNFSQAVIVQIGPQLGIQHWFGERKETKAHDPQNTKFSLSFVFFCFCC